MIQCAVTRELTSHERERESENEQRGTITVVLYSGRPINSLLLANHMTRCQGVVKAHPNSWLFLEPVQ